MGGVVLRPWGCHPWGCSVLAVLSLDGAILRGGSTESDIMEPPVDRQV